MNTTLAPRFKIALPKTKTRNPAKLLPAGTDHIRIFGRAPGPFTIAWREQPDAALQRTTRATWKKAKAFADAKATQIANLVTGLKQIEPAEAADYLRAMEQLAPFKKTLPLAIAEYVDFLRAIEGASPAEVAQFWKENRPRGFVPRAIPELVEQFLAQQEGQISAGWHSHLSHDLNRFAGQFNCHLHALRSADLNAWLRGLDIGARTRHNYRAALEQLVRWAQANGHLPRTWSEMERVADPGAKMGDIKILTPEQMTRLIAGRQQAEEHGRAWKSLVPFIALQAFAGIRHEEMNGEKAMLDWRDVHLEERYIYVPKAVAKTGRDRTVPISDNLAAWLQLYVRRNGPITSLAQTSGALTKAKKAAGIPAGDNETRNVLRKSFISYRKAVVKNIAQVAEEAGNSVGIIRKHYGRIIPEAEAQRWFSIWPTTADVLQLNFAGL